MSYKITLSPAAEATIAAQVKWYRENDERGGDELASRWFEQLHKELRALSSSPTHYGLAPKNGRWMRQHELRQMPFRPWRSGVGWRVLYTVDEERKLVTVLQVRHEHRRWLHEEDEEDQPT